MLDGGLSICCNERFRKITPKVFEEFMAAKFVVKHWYINMAPSNHVTEWQNKL